MRLVAKTTARRDGNGLCVWVSVVDPMCFDAWFNRDCMFVCFCVLMK